MLLVLPPERLVGPLVLLVQALLLLEVWLIWVLLLPYKRLQLLRLLLV
jgi:hypothetical protein